MATIADDFNRANAANLGGNWTDDAIGSAMRIVSNTAQQTTASTNGSAHYSATTLAVPHWAKAPVLLGAGDCIVGVEVRHAASPTLTWYHGGIDRTGGVLTTVITKIVAGTPTVLSQIATALTSGTVELFATGTTTTVLTLVIDGVMVNQVSDSASPLSTQTRVGIIDGGSIGSLTEFNAADVAGVPLAPLNLAATPQNGSIALTWTAPFDRMSAITDYLIEYSTNGSSWSTFSDGTSTTPSTTITGLTNGTPYYTRVSAINAIGTGPVVTSVGTVTPQQIIEFVGVGAFAVSTTSGGGVTAAFPAGYSAVADDLCILAMQGKHNNGSSLAPTAPSGFSQVDTEFRDIGTYDIQLTVDIDRFAGGESAPVPTVPAAYSTSSGGLSAYQAIFRGQNLTTAQDAASVGSQAAGATSFAPTGIVTVTEGAAVISIVETADDNAVALGTDQGFTLIAGGASYDTDTGGDHAAGMAWRLGAQQALQTQAAAPAQLTAIDGVAGTAYNYRWTGLGVTIFVPGGGIRGTHTEFTSRLGAGYAAAAATGASAFTDNTASNALFTPQGHDTGVASVALGTTQGVAKGATVYPLTCVNAAQSAASDFTKPMPATLVLDLLAHILSVAVPGESVVGWSNIGHASGEQDSSGGTLTSQNITDMTAAVQAIINAGIPFVVSAGNQASSSYMASHFPMNMADVINVGNVSGASPFDKSTTSNFGADVDIWAPGCGTGTDSASAAGNSSFNGSSATGGTSEAAYVVCGVIACLLQGHPSYTPAQLKSILTGANALTTGSTGAGSNTLLANSLYMPPGAIGTSVCPTWSSGNASGWVGITMALAPEPTAVVESSVNVASFFFT